MSEAAPGWRDRARAELAHVKAALVTNGGAPLPLVGRDVAVVVLACVLLTLFYYFARPDFYRSRLDTHVVSALGWQTSPYRGLLPYWYWSMASTVLRVLIPLGCIVWWFRESPRDYGFRLWERGHGKIYAAMYVFMLPLLVAMSFTKSFQGKYPFYKAAGDSWQQFVAFELAYGVQFAALEAFFRGFLVFALFKRFGYFGVVIMTLPYCLIHFGKPPAETLGAIVAGLVLGFMALHSKSWLPGALVHWSVGFTMDVACILQKLSQG